MITNYMVKETLVEGFLLLWNFRLNLVFSREELQIPWMVFFLLFAHQNTERRRKT